MSAGSLNLQEIAPLIGWDPQVGDFKTRRWRGSRSACEAYGILLKDRGIGYSIDDVEQGLIYQISAKITGDDTASSAEPIATLWAFRSAEIQIAAWQCEKIQTELAKLPFDETTNRDDASKLRTWFDAYLNGARTIEGPEGESLPIDATILQTLVISLGMLWDPFDKLIQARCKGFEAFQRSAPILRRTVIVNGRSVYKSDDSKKDKVIATALLKVQEKIPDNVPFTLPTGYWLRSQTEAEQSGPDRWSLVTTWEFAKSYEKLGYEEVTS